MTAHGGKLYESVGILSGVKFYRYECPCGYKTLDESDPGLARDAFRRHVEREKAKECAACA